MLKTIIKFSLNNRLLTLLLGVGLIVIGLWTMRTTPVDVFPDLTAPTVSVITEAPGMAPEEIELLVTFPLETALNGSANIRRVRSISSEGVSNIWVEFEWGEDIYRARQIVSEKLQTVELPQGIESPQMGAISSIMGEIMYLAVTSDTYSPMELRLLVETNIVRRFQAIPGISKVLPVGGEIRQFTVQVDPLLLSQYKISIEEVCQSLSEASVNPSAGFNIQNGQEYLVRGMGRAEDVDDIAHTVLRVTGGIPLTIDDIAQVTVDARPKRGTASYNSHPAIVISLQKQPGINTIELTNQIEQVVAELKGTLPAGVSISKDSFKQADFIKIAIGNISKALRDGAFLVIFILFFFLGNFRSTLISALAIPLSLLGGILVISYFGHSINTMTLGGLTIAIGALVDDAIIDVENVFRRLKLERLLPQAERRSNLEIVFTASSEVRSAIFFATLIIILVFLPIFFLPGMEGRLLLPLGLGYVAALISSLVVSLTITPVLCYYLISKGRVLDRKEPRLVRFLKASYKRILAWSIKNPKKIYAIPTLLTLLVLAGVPFLGRSFLPEFNEGAFTITLASPPGTTLEASNQLGHLTEKSLLDFPEVVSTVRRTGRGEKDEHGMGVHASEIEVVLREGRSKSELLEAMRRALAWLPGTNISFGQPISHRIDHMISGSKTNLAIKVFGPDMAILRQLTREIKETVEEIPNVVDISNQEQSVIPQLIIDYDDVSMAQYGLRPAALSQTIEALFQGTTAGELIRDGIVSPLVVKFSDNLREFKEHIELLPVLTAKGNIISLGDIARVRYDLGPFMIRREHVQRSAVLTANIAGRDKTGVAEKVHHALIEKINMPSGYHFSLEGQFDEATQSFRNLAALSLLVLVGIYFLLFSAFKNHRHTMIVLVNLPLALIGGVIALFLGSKVISLASMVGFITLFGIATRNGVLLVSHYQHLIHKEGLGLKEAVLQGSLERLAPVLMTALTAGLALVPLVLEGLQPGNEIQSPMAEVILGGLVTSTLLNMLIVPLLFLKWGGHMKIKKSERLEAI